MTTSTSLKRTPLYDIIQFQKARMTDFEGWEMPVQFAGLKQEHQAVRTTVGMFDISHMGQFYLQGENLISALQYLVPSDLSRLKKGQAQYSVLLNEEGGIIDDIIYYSQGEMEGIMIVNASTLETDKAWILKHLENTGVTLEDLSTRKVLIALQGKEAINILQPLVSSNIKELKAFEHCTTTLFNEEAFVARTGYTGEDGFEIMVSPTVGQQLWLKLTELGVTPCGLGARDTLRLEAGMALYGQDINTTTTPLEAGLGWLVHLDSKDDFIGKSVLQKQKELGVKRRLMGIKMMGRHIARHDYPVWINGEKVGVITSGTASPTLGGSIGLVYLPIEYAKVGESLEVEIRGQHHPAIVVKKPFYKRSY